MAARIPCSHPLARALAWRELRHRHHLLYIAQARRTKGCQDPTQTKSSATRDGGGSDVKQSLSGVGAAVTDAYTGCRAEGAPSWRQLEDHSLRPDSQKEPRWARQPHGVMPHQGEGGRGWSERSVTRNKGDSAQKWHLSKAEAVIARACTGSIRNSLDLRLWVDCFSPCLVKSWEPTGPLLLSTAPPWGRHASARSGERTHSRGTEQLRPCTQAVCSSSAEFSPTLSRPMAVTAQSGSPGSHLAPATTPPPPVPPPPQAIVLRTPCR